MPNPFPQDDPTLESAIASAYSDLSKHNADTEEYQKIVNQLTALYKIKNSTLQHFQDAQQSEVQLQQSAEQLAQSKYEFEQTHQLALDTAYDARELNERPFLARVDPNTAVTVLGNLIIGFAVIKYEHTGVIATRVRDFMRKI